MVPTLWIEEGESWPGAEGHKRGRSHSSQEGGPAVGSSRYSAPSAAAVKASGMRSPDILLTSGRVFVGARV